MRTNIRICILNIGRDVYMYTSNIDTDTFTYKCVHRYLFYKALLQKRPISLRSLLIVATPYVHTQT